MSIITNVLKIYEKSSCKSCVECSVELCRAENISKFYEIGSFASFNSTWYWCIYNTLYRYYEPNGQSTIVTKLSFIDKVIICDSGCQCSKHI